MGCDAARLFGRHSRLAGISAQNSDGNGHGTLIAYLSEWAEFLPTGSGAWLRYVRCRTLFPGLVLVGGMTETSGAAGGLAGSTARGVSPYATGGGGVTLERRVAA